MDGSPQADIFSWQKTLVGLPLGFPAHIAFSPEQARAFIHTLIAVNTYDNCHGQPDAEALKSKPSVNYQTENSNIIKAEAVHKVELHEAAVELRETEGFPLDAYQAIEALAETARHQVRLDLRQVLVVTDPKGHLHTLLPIEVLFEIITKGGTGLYPEESLTEDEHRDNVIELMDLYSEWMVCTDIGDEATANETCFDLSVILKNADLRKEFLRTVNRDRDELIATWNTEKDESLHDQGVIISHGGVAAKKN